MARVTEGKYGTAADQETRFLSCNLQRNSVPNLRLDFPISRAAIIINAGGSERQKRDACVGEKAKRPVFFLAPSQTPCADRAVFPRLIHKEEGEIVKETSAEAGPKTDESSRLLYTDENGLVRTGKSHYPETGETDERAVAPASGKNQFLPLSSPFQIFIRSPAGKSHTV